MSDSPSPGAPGEPGGDQPGSDQPGAPGHGQPGPYAPHGEPGYGQPGGPGHGQPGGPGYGQPGGYPPYPQPAGYYPYGQPNSLPPAPQPGGIPLRPMSVSEILSGAFTSIRQNPAATLGMSAILLTLYGLVSTVASLVVRNVVGAVQLPAAGQQLTPAQGRHLLSQLLTIGVPAFVVVIVLAFLVELILTGLLTVVVGRGVLGRKVSMGEAWRIGRPRLPAVLGAWLLSGIIIVGMWVALTVMIVLLAAVHAGPAAAVLGVLGAIAALCLTIWFSVSFSLAAPVIVLEGYGPASALGRSWRLVRRSFWRIFGVLVLAGLAVIIAGLVLQIPFSILAGLAGGSGQLFGLMGTRTVTAVIIAAVGNIVAGAVTRPIGAGVIVLLYLDMRMRKEGLDLALQGAAQNQQLTGDEFATLWRPPAGGSRSAPQATGSGSWPPPAGPGTAAPPSW